ncbi:MAG: hypothetical protein JXJ30_01330, partial [Halothiobacillaceae bacterium]|nr:hypothetical protein [Halothiobacillaceae bacterium]
AQLLYNNLLDAFFNGAHSYRTSSGTNTVRLNVLARQFRANTDRHSIENRRAVQIKMVRPDLAPETAGRSA